MPPSLRFTGDGGGIDSIAPFLAQLHQTKNQKPSPRLGPWLDRDDDGVPSFPGRKMGGVGSSRAAISIYSYASTSTAPTALSSVWDHDTGSVATGRASQPPSQPHSQPSHRHQHGHNPSSSSSSSSRNQGSSAASTSSEAPERHEFLTDQALRVIREQAEPPSTFRNPPPRMPCEFSRYTGCDLTFCPDTQVEQLIDHELRVHLNYNPPATCLCWFCDDFKFESDVMTEGDRRHNFGNRMMHIAQHFQDAERGTIRPDFFFLDHLRLHGLISMAVFEREKNIHETDQVEGLKPLQHKTQRMAREEEQRSMVIVQDSRREERERRRRQDERRRPRDK
ncbi:unnamed protein product [Parascedosporium putredinis]|uniref:Uncharacterized protein n=1 Tax=Parascedosporium putredinis TaxID=1442378 RepID=A0A9P1MD30_9PEZI|nr:unnamed protein product [Parascedosporium putredinis]CAI7999618.1 unnamed protein product [Parascedosporium putredinis]